MKVIVYLAFCLPLVFAQTSEEMASQFYDLFYTESPEWRLAFRGTPGISKSVWAAYAQHQTTTVEPGCLEIFSNEPCAHHFRNNDVLDNWANIEQVAFVVFKDGKRVAHVIFDASGTDNQNWCTDKKIVSSSWADITNTSKNYFSLGGDQNLQRRLFMNHGYGGCPNDVGWFVAVDRSNVPCQWEKTGTFPLFLYATKNTMTNWTKGDVAQADFFAIFVKYSTSSVVGR